MQEPGPNAVDVFDQLLASNAQIQLELEALKAQIAGTFEVRLAQVFFVVGKGWVATLTRRRRRAGRRRRMAPCAERD